MIEALVLAATITCQVNALGNLVCRDETGKIVSVTDTHGTTRDSTGTVTKRCIKNSLGQERCYTK